MTTRYSYNAMNELQYDVIQSGDTSTSTYHHIKVHTTMYSLSWHMYVYTCIYICMGMKRYIKVKERDDVGSCGIMC